MIPTTNAQAAFIYLATHAKIHAHLSQIDSRYRRLLHEIERKEIHAYNDDVTYERLEALKKELIDIRFIEKNEEGPTGPSP